MKKITLLLISAFLLISCQKTKPLKSLEISGEITGLKQGKLYLKSLQDSVLIALDSAMFNGASTYSLSSNIEEPQWLYLQLDRGVSSSEDNILPFFAEPGKMTINSSLKRFFFDAKITGSENQELFNTYIVSRKKLIDKQNELIKDQFMAAKNNLKTKSDSIQEVVKKYELRIYLNAVNYVIKHPNKEIAPYIALTDVLSVSSKYLDTINASITPEIHKSYYGKILKHYTDSIKK